MRCLKKSCSAETEQVGEIYSIKFKGIHRVMQNYQCIKCKESFSAPVGALTKKEFNNFKDE